jgi:hypothetical protein
MMEKQAQLTRLLLRKSRKGEIDWRPTIHDNTFQVAFKDNTVRIVQRDEDPAYAIYVANSEGTVVDHFSYEELTEAGAALAFDETWFTILRDLYDLARRTALGSEKIISDILSELDDEIPF